MSELLSSSSACPASSSAPVRVLTELDHVRIGRWVAAQARTHTALQRVLDDADLVPSEAVDPDVVTMRSRVRVSDPAGGEAREITLAYPDEADAAHGQVSVLSPVGAALLGLRAGAVARWTLPDGRAAALRVDAVAFQPEAAGELLR